MNPLIVDHILASRTVLQSLSHDALMMHQQNRTSSLSVILLQGVNTPQHVNIDTTTDIPIVAALPLPCDTSLDMDIDGPSELKATHDVGSVILAILIYKEYKDSTKPAIKRDMDKELKL